MKTFLLILIVSCSLSVKNPFSPKVPLEERGWTKEERIAFMDTNRDLYPFFIRNCFIDRRFTMALPKNLIVYLYGLPDKEYGDSVWYYIDEKKQLILKFNDKDQLIDY